MTQVAAGSRRQAPENETSIVYATFPSVEEAERIGGLLVQWRLAACVNLIDGMRSIYRWDGKIETGREVVGVIKTRRVLAERVVGAVKVLHSYDNPAVVVLPALGGSDTFLYWIRAETAD
ncbi:MAG: divalent-cation tolerance protein CutA [Hyphomicrobiaceae bacterium]